MKGLSDIVAIILLVLLAVGAAGMFFLWEGSFRGGLGDQTGREIEGYAERTGMRLNIETVSQCNIYVRNQGTEKIPVSSINLNIDGRPVQFETANETIELGEMAQLSIISEFICESKECTVRVIVSDTQSIAVPAAELQCVP